MADLVEVARFTWRHEAEMARGVLEGAGIPAGVIADDAGGQYAGIAPARLVVAHEDAGRARRILDELDAGPDQGRPRPGGRAGSS